MGWRWRRSAIPSPRRRALGVDTFRTKLTIYVVTARLHRASSARSYFLQKLRLTPEVGFSINDWTVVVIFMVVIGGIGTLEGPILGILVYFGLREILAQYGTWYLILLGMAAVATMLRAGGAVGPRGQALRPAPLLSRCHLSQ